MATTEASAERDGSRATLEIVGTPGGDVTIYAPDRGDNPPPPIFEGAVPATGRLRLRVPKAYLVVVATGFGSAPVHFEDGTSFRSVDLRHGAQPSSDT